MDSSLQDVLNSMQVICAELTKVINLNIIVTFIGTILSFALVLYVAWFGIRTLINSVKNALHGKLIVGSEAHRRYYKNKLGWDDEDYNDNFNQW